MQLIEWVVFVNRKEKSVTRQKVKEHHGVLLVVVEVVRVKGRVVEAGSGDAVVGAVVVVELVHFR